MLDAKDEESSEEMCNIDHEVATPYTIHSVVLPKPSLINANINSAITAMLDIVQPKNDDTMKMIPIARFYLTRIMPETDQLFQCHVNQMSQLFKGLTTKQYFWFFVKVFLTDCQLNNIGNILLLFTMVDSMILYSLLMVSINCSVHVAFEAQLESPEKTGYFEKSWCVGQLKGISKTTNLGKRSPPLPKGKVPQCKGL